MRLMVVFVTMAVFFAAANCKSRANGGVPGADSIHTATGQEPQGNCLLVGLKGTAYGTEIWADSVNQIVYRTYTGDTIRFFLAGATDSISAKYSYYLVDYDNLGCINRLRDFSHREPSHFNETIYQYTDSTQNVAQTDFYVHQDTGMKHFSRVVYVWQNSNCVEEQSYAYDLSGLLVLKSKTLTTFGAGRNPLATAPGYYRLIYPPSEFSQNCMTTRQWGTTTYSYTYQYNTHGYVTVSEERKSSSSTIERVRYFYNCR